MNEPSDFKVVNHGSIILFTPHTDEAKQWIDDNISDDAQFWGDSLVVEPRYAGPLANGIAGDGLSIQ